MGAEGSKAEPDEADECEERVKMACPYSSSR